MFDEILIRPVLDLVLKFISLLNQIPMVKGENFKNPFTEVLYTNTQHLQRTLRRALFKTLYSKKLNVNNQFIHILSLLGER